jgi:hypothetical protein
MLDELTVESLLHVFPKYDQTADGDGTDGDTNKPEVKKSVADIAFGTRLRILALMYYYANKLERAQTFRQQVKLFPSLFRIVTVAGPGRNPAML